MIISLFFTILFVFLLIISFLKIRNSKKSFQFIYSWAWPLGAFVWEDLFIFSLLGLIITSIVSLTNDARIGYLFFLVFWIVRSGGESLYFFLQQFFEPKQYPHDIKDQLKILRYIFGNISEQKGYILLQVFHQSVVVIAIVLTILLLLNWNNVQSSQQTFLFE